MVSSSVPQQSPARALDSGPGVGGRTVARRNGRQAALAAAAVAALVVAAISLSTAGDAHLTSRLVVAGSILALAACALLAMRHANRLSDSLVLAHRRLVAIGDSAH